MGKGTKRNKLCDCGSGKKIKNCCEGRKPVSQMIAIKHEEPTVVNGVRISPDGQVEFLEDGKALTPQRAWTASFRKREKGEKKLFNIPISTNLLQVGEVNALQNYDRIFGIDTNTKKVDGTVISLGLIVEGRFRTSHNGEVFEDFILGAFEVHNGPQKAENFSWYLLVNAILNSSDYLPENSYGLVTDSDLGMHEEFNSRNAPIFGEHLLPENFTLIYAHDKGAFLVNGLLRLCDKEAGKMLKELADGSISMKDAFLINSGVCEHFRGWKNTNSELLNAGWFRLGDIPSEAFNG